jgi:hypothetical protein
MADPAPSQPCSRCGAEIITDDLAQGLAVRLDGVPVCASCVDGLPVVAQVAINRLRALRGLPTTTFRVTLPRHPRTNAFSFTTSGNQLLHRRQLLAGKEFTAPLLLPVAKPQAPAEAPPPPRRLAPLLFGMGGGIVLAGAAAFVALVHFMPAGPPAGPTVVPPAAPVAVPQPGPVVPPSPTPILADPLTGPAAEPTRRDYPADPLAAVIAAAGDPSCPPAVQARILEEALAVADLQVRRIEATRNRQAAAALILPELAQFDGLRARLMAVQALAPEPGPSPAPRPVAPAQPADPPAVIPPPTAAAVPQELPSEEPPSAPDIVLSQLYPPAAQRLPCLLYTSPSPRDH